MTSADWRARLLDPSAPASVLLIRLFVGLIFLSEGAQKFLFPEALGAGRFLRLGLPAPGALGPLVGALELTGGLLLVAGLLTRLIAAPLLINMLVAITVTKLSVLQKSGFWVAAHEARTDFAMILGLLFLLSAGSGPLSLDARIARHQASQAGGR